MQWFRENQITVMDWLALNPDLNPMENLWGRLTRDIYANGGSICNSSRTKAANRKKLVFSEAGISPNSCFEHA